MYCTAGTHVSLLLWRFECCCFRLPQTGSISSYIIIIHIYNRTIYHTLSFFPRWRSGSRTGVLNRRRTRGRIQSCVQWFQKQQRPAASSDYWSRDGCWRLQACQGSYPTVALALWALPCALPLWLCPATVAAAAAVAAARQAVVLLYLPPPAQGQQQACRAPQRLTASSPSPCPPYLVVSLAESPPTPCPWLDHWLETCRNFLPATWAPLLLSLTRGPMAKIP